MPDELEREIEEILNKIDRFVPGESRFTRLRRRWRNRVRRFRHNLAGTLSRISLSHVMIASLLLIVVAFFIRWSALGRYMLLAGLILLFSTIAISFFSSRRTAVEKRWRGQVIELSGPTLGDRVRSWLRRRRGPRY